VACSDSFTLKIEGANLYIIFI